MRKFVFAALIYVVNECDADLEEHCASLELDEDRVAQCLQKSEISTRCNPALDDVGLE
jgi:hypothetical protein